MRLDELALTRWGGFTDRRVAFEPGARLHVVLGANEAGKTTLLRGVRDLLFGIERNTSFDYLHAMPNLLLGGVVGDQGGRRLAFQRRKGLKNTLLDEAGKPLADGALAPWLGDVDRRLFESFFGLDHQTMRSGGEAMLQAQGDVGGTLFAASSGLRNLIQVRRALDDEADALFGRRRKGDRVFYQALDRLESAQDTIRRASLQPDQWHKLERDGSEARERQRRAHAETGTVRRRRDRLEALRRAAPLLRDIDRIAAELAELADAPVLPDDFEVRVAATQTELTTAMAVHAQQELALGAMEAERAGIAVDAAVIAAAPLVEAVHSRIGAWPGQVADLHKLDRDRRLIDEEIASILAEMGEAADAVGPGESEAMALRALVTRRTALLTRRDEIAERLSESVREERRLAARAAELVAVGRPVA
ncbi:MAG: AAA family ATPase, partial [Alphaproteobacteria bacterium]|nr:AAA family ATPase [Alphaproteobacteria bacterium]